MRVACGKVTAWQLALVPLVLVATHAHGQTENLMRLPEVIVTAPSPDRSLRRTPHGVSVITAADIAQSAATTDSRVCSACRPI